MEFKRKILWNLLMTTTIAIITFLCTFETAAPNNQDTSIDVHKTSRCLTTHHEYIKNDVAYIFFTDIFIPSYATGCSVNEYQYSLKLPTRQIQSTCTVYPSLSRIYPVIYADGSYTYNHVSLYKHVINYYSSILHAIFYIQSLSVYKQFK